MQRGDFFANIKNIILFGVFGTFVAFTSFSLMTIGLKNSIPMTMYKRNDETGLYTESELNLTA